MRLSEPLASGIFFIGFGGFALYAGAGLPTGVAADMGTGYVPRFLAWGCIGIGCLLLAQAWWRRVCAAATVSLALKPVLLVTTMVLAFAFLLPRLGLPITVAITIATAAISGERFRWVPLACITIGMAVLTTLLFSWGLGLQIQVWPK